ncbi:MAG: NAD-dependent epimerase/dehydratase family protein [Deltaproteobacteria bacterium]|nr:NAD-dependent epimerase/dehydratase family protein [Deltaproteobacteria bacterium]
MSTQNEHTGSIVVIGVRGFRGHNLLKRLERDPKYKRVVAIDHKKPDLTLKKTKYYKLDLTEPLADDSLKEILIKEECDTLVHAAFPITPPHNEALAHEVIAIGTFYILNACAAAGVRKFIMASTTDVYGAFPSNPNYLTEDMPPRANRLSRFLADKIDAEKQALRFQKKYPDRVVSILRVCNVLGPTINSYKTRYLQRSVITTMLGFDPLIQFVHEEDVKNVMQQLVDEDHPGVFNLAGDGVLPLSRVIEICGKVNLRLTQIGFKTMAQLMWLMDLSPAPASHVDFLRYLCVVDNSKIKKQLHYKPKYTTKEALLTFVGADRLRQLNMQQLST